MLAAYREALDHPAVAPNSPLINIVPGASETEVSQRELPMIGRRDARPAVPRGYPIGAYTDYDLRRLVEWVRSDGMLRTEEELIEEVMRDLGFQRRGRNVVARITSAIRTSRRE